VPLERWDIERVYAPGLASDRMYARHAAWLGGVDRFDAALFGFSKAQATATDPQVRFRRACVPVLIIVLLARCYTQC
jgi:acyl transferase domain-containing protein